MSMQKKNINGRYYYSLPNSKEWTDNLADAQSAWHNYELFRIASGGEAGKSGSNVWRQMSGSGMTDAEIEAMQANQASAELAWNRSEQSADNALQRTRELRQTAYQDMVSSANAAGINPIFALSGGAMGASSGPQGSVTSPQTSSNSGSGIADMLAALSLRSEIDVNKSVIRKNDAEASQARANADIVSKESNWVDVEKSAQVESTRATASLDRSKVVEIGAHLRDMYYDWNLKQSEIKLNDMDYKVKDAMLPLMQLEMSARTAQEKTQAMLLAVQRAHELGLLTHGIITKELQRMDADISRSKAEAAATDMLNGNITDNEIANRGLRVLFGLTRGMLSPIMPSAH